MIGIFSIENVWKNIFIVILDVITFGEIILMMMAMMGLMTWPGKMMDMLITTLSLQPPGTGIGGSKLTRYFMSFINWHSLWLARNTQLWRHSGLWTNQEAQLISSTNLSHPRNHNCLQLLWSFNCRFITQNQVPSDSIILTLSRFDGIQMCAEGRHCSYGKLNWESCEDGSLVQSLRQTQHKICAFQSTILKRSDIGHLEILREN